MEQVATFLGRHFTRSQARANAKVHAAPSAPVSSLIGILILLLSSLPARALVLTDEKPYYGREFYQQVRTGLRDTAVINLLHDIVSRTHQQRPGQPDEIGTCSLTESSCYGHTSVGYKSARRIIMGRLFLKGSSPNWYITDVYCEKDYGRDDFQRSGPAPDVAPDETVINIEHTWPQSRFSTSVDANTQKSDLHHLFPASTTINGIRGNLKFAEVDRPALALVCPQNKLGSVKGQHGDYFEPPNSHKGNVARALFYFSVRYQMHIDPDEEVFLRKWNQQDPVDREERQRNDQIMMIQGNRNPFVDHPELVEAIADF